MHPVVGFCIEVVFKKYNFVKGIAKRPQISPGSTLANSTENNEILETI